MAEDSDLAAFQTAATEKLEELQSFIQAFIPQKGNTSETCQRTAFELKILELQALVNGTESEDFKNEDGKIVIETRPMELKDLGKEFLAAMEQFNFEVSIGDSAQISVEVYDEKLHGYWDDCDHVVLIPSRLSELGQVLADFIQMKRTGETCTRFITNLDSGLTGFYITHA